MSLLTDLQQQLLDATKKQDTIRLSTLRMLVSAIRYKEVEKKKSLTDDEIREVIGSEAKRRREAVAEYQKAGRSDLADKEEAERVILQAYLPAMLTEAELKVIVEATIRDVGAVGKSDAGKVMSALMPKIKGRADGRSAQALVGQLLS